MSLKDRITEDMKAAMRAKDAERLGTIRMLLAACKQREVDERIVLDDAAVIGLVDKLIKQRKDSITAFEQGGRADLVAKESAEIVVLQAYLPQRLSADETAAAVAAPTWWPRKAPRSWCCRPICRNASAPTKPPRRWPRSWRRSAPPAPATWAR
jgi:uncharacterized protein YqeY